MTVTNTSLLGLALPTTGTESGVWGDDVNNGLTILIDVSVAGTNNITQDSDITLAVSNGNNSSSFTSTATNSAVAQYYVLNCSGARTALRNIIVPTTSKTYVVTNGTTGGFGITVKKSGGTGVTVAAGETAIVFYNTVTGDVAKVTSTVNVSSFSAGTTGFTPSTATTGAITLAGTLATTNGGTGLTSFTSGGVVYASSTSALATGSALTFDGTNFGLGVTPSAWSSVFKAFQVRGTSISNATDTSIFSNNWFFNASNVDTYMTNGTAQMFSISGGVFKWRQATYGTAGNAITFTDAMTLDASGQLLIGATSGSYPLVVKKAASSSDTSSIQIMSGTAGYSQLLFGNTGSDSPGYLAYNNSSNFLAIATNGSERARIDSSGNLLVGTTSNSATSGIVHAQSATNSTALGGYAKGTTSSAVGLYIKTDSSNALYAYWNCNGVNTGTISTTGTTTLYNTTSDQRLKENIQDADSASSLIDSIQVRKFDWITDKTHQRYGFIAQELVTVAPEAVHQPLNPDDMMAVDYSKLVPMLVKEIQSLRQRLSAANL